MVFRIKGSTEAERFADKYFDSKIVMTKKVTVCDKCAKTTIVKDDDGHWYRINIEDKERFSKWEEMGTEEMTDAFLLEMDYFSGFMIDECELR
jgi:hypothetical protein